MLQRKTQEMLIYQWVTGFFSTPVELMKALRDGDIPCEGGNRYLALILRIDSYHRQMERLGTERIHQIKREMLALCQKSLTDAYCCQGGDTYVAAVLIRKGYIAPDSLNEPLDEIRNAVQQRYDISLTIGVGTHAISPMDVPGSLRNAHMAVRYRFVFGMGQTILYENIVMRVGMSPSFPEEEFTAVMNAFERGDSATFEQRLGTLFSANYTQSMQYGQAAITHLLVEMYRCMSQSVQAECDLVGVFTSLGECDHISQQLQVIRNFGLSVIEARNEGTVRERHRQSIQDILAYVDSHYDNPDLSITSIAEYAKLSTNTVRLLFREYGLTSPKEYILRLRMDHACQLLAETSLTAKEVGERVGFTDSRYFYAVFKKYTGKTAYEYRTRLGG